MGKVKKKAPVRKARKVTGKLKVKPKAKRKRRPPKDSDMMEGLAMMGTHEKAQQKKSAPPKTDEKDEGVSGESPGAPPEPEPTEGGEAPQTGSGGGQVTPPHAAE